MVLPTILNFNTSNVKVQHCSSILSATKLLVFQYIQCEGSAKNSRSLTPTIWYFNTSNVKVQPDNSSGLWMAYSPFQYIQCEGSAVWWSGYCNNWIPISIHPMWRFSCCNRCTFGVEIKISIHPMWRFSNTVGDEVIIQLVNFNTSNVKVQQHPRELILSRYSNFNTSNVKVQQDSIGLRAEAVITFQYIQCEGSALYKWI